MHAHLKERERKTERETRRPAENIHKYTQQTWGTWNDTQGKEHEKKKRETRHKDTHTEGARGQRHKENLKVKNLKLDHKKTLKHSKNNSGPTSET